ncbi:AbiV family abortive infection protein [Microbacterium sp. A93]|uniref:AbiV family abortive infection protein n=1 Tax=Microbacterium sp. A93 TaxID=3450716 RepID=UPI003F43F2FE
MQARRLSSIVQVPKHDRFEILSEGLKMISENLSVLVSDIKELDERRRYRAAAVLRVFAEEEAAKVLIILDLARAGWSDAGVVQRTIRSFYNHLSRGLYVKAYEWAPADLAEVRRYIEQDRREFYLDGPMDVDWIFANEVVSGREERLYVDYVEDEDGEGRWVGPKDHSEIYEDPMFFRTPRISRIIRLVEHMSEIGLLATTGLEATRKVFDGVALEDSTRWGKLQDLNVQVIKRLSLSRCYTVSDHEALLFVIEHWTFPLTGLDLTMKRIDPNQLKQARARALAREFGMEDYGY